jgi:hypothetical protein
MPEAYWAHIGADSYAIHIESRFAPAHEGARLDSPLQEANERLDPG